MKDLKSYVKHDSEYHLEINNVQQTKIIIEKYEKNKQFEISGFKLALRLTSEKPKIHVDIGTGNGWLLRKMSPFFEKTIGVEPSKKAIDLCREVHSDIKNIELINMDMCDALDFLKLEEPIFITTGVVLSHIEDYYVAEFLQKVNSLPKGSVLFFDEQYGKKLSLNLWHIRNKDWWADNLPNWQVIFLDINIGNCKSGIYGICTQDEKNERKRDTAQEIIAIRINGYVDLINRLVKKIARKFKK